MKTITIEQVSNGWIVRPFNPSCPDWASERPAMAVFNTIDALLQAMPALLDAPDSQFCQLCRRWHTEGVMHSCKETTTVK